MGRQRTVPVVCQRSAWSFSHGHESAHTPAHRRCLSQAIVAGRAQGDCHRCKQSSRELKSANHLASHVGSNDTAGMP